MHEFHAEIPFEGGKMRKVKWWQMIVVLALAASAFAAKEAPRVDKETLKSWLADPQVLIVDVRVGRGWTKSDKKIAGAVRQEPKRVKTWAAGLPKDKKIVLYCA
jgi:predicted sulfurtransferase